MDPLLLICVAAVIAFIVAIVNPFWVLPIFILGNFVEPVQYLPELRAYKPSVLLGVIILLGWILHLIMKRDFESAKCRQVTYSIAFMAWLFVSSIINKGSMGELINHLRTYIPYFLFLYMVKDEKQVITILWVFIFLGIVAGIYGLYCVKMNIGIYDRGIKRFTSFFANPNNFGEVNTLLIPLAIIFMVYNYNILIKMALMFLIFLFLYGILISNSRMCFFALIPGIFGTAIKIYPKKNKIIPFVIALLCCLMVYYILPDRVKWRYTSRINSVFHAESAESLDAGRTDTAKAGLKMILENPIFGVGFGGFRDEYAELASVDSEIELHMGSTSKILRPHNVIIEAGVYSGIIGLLLFLSSVYLSYMGANRAEKRFFLSGNKPMRLASIYLQIFIACGMILGQMSPYLTSKYFWMVIPISARIEAISLNTLRKPDD